jgi:hypothetical protein
MVSALTACARHHPAVRDHPISELCDLRSNPHRRGHLQQSPGVNLFEARALWQRDGFVILPGYVSDDVLGTALKELSKVFPTAEQFHNDVGAERNRRFRDEFGGIVDFPFPSTELNLLSVHPALIDLGEALLECDHTRVYSIEAWAKFTGAAKYDQHLHRDYLNHTVLVPAPSARADQVEMFLFLSDVPAELGPPSYVPMEAGTYSALPNWYPRHDGVIDPDAPSTWVSEIGHPALYAEEISAAGPAGTVVAYRLDTFHRATELTQPRGARYTIHVNFRRASADWVGRHSWPSRSTTSEWVDFVVRASPRQLQLFGFPAPGQRYWTPETLAGMAQRYPGFNSAPWLE